MPGELSVPVRISILLRDVLVVRAEVFKTILLSWCAILKERERPLRIAGIFKENSGSDTVIAPFLGHFWSFPGRFW